MTKREAKRVKVGDNLRYKPSGKVGEVVRIYTTHPDPRAKVPLFRLRGQPTAVTYVLCETEE